MKTIAALLILVLLAGTPLSAYEYDHFVCTTTATQIYAGGPYKVLAVKNITAGSTVYLGFDDDVTTSNGWSLAAGAGHVFENASERLYCTVTTGTAAVEYYLRK